MILVRVENSFSVNLLVFNVILGDKFKYLIKNGEILRTINAQTRIFNM